MKKNSNNLVFLNKNNSLSLNFFMCFFLFFYFLFSFDMAYAACECKCISGNVKLVCKGKVNFKPICTPRICAKSKTIVPIKRKFVPPPPVVKFTDCEQRKVLNPSTNKFIWRTICRPDNSFQ